MAFSQNDTQKNYNQHNVPKQNEAQLNGILPK